MSNYYYGKIELPQKYSYQGNEHYLSSEKSDAYLWLADENTKQANEIKRLQEQLDDANHILKDVFISDAYYKSKRAQYLKKWSVK